MKTLRRPFLLLLAAPLLSACFSTTTIAVPATAPAREATSVRGVVVRQAGGGEETLEFDEVLESTWTPTSLSMVGMWRNPDNGDQLETITRLFPISTMAGLRVRQLDAGKTSAIIGGVLLGTAALIASLVSGTAGY